MLINKIIPIRKFLLYLHPLKIKYAEIGSPISKVSISRKYIIDLFCAISCGRLSCFLNLPLTVRGLGCARLKCGYPSPSSKVVKTRKGTRLTSPGDNLNPVLPAGVLGSHIN